jgi:hypothetical protein
LRFFQLPLASASGEDELNTVGFSRMIRLKPLLFLIPLPSS